MGPTRATATSMRRARSSQGQLNQPRHRRQWPRARSPLYLFGVATVSLATVLYGGTLSALAGSTTASRQSVGRVAPPDGLTLNSEETQLDCCPNVTGTSVGQEAGPTGKSRGDRTSTVVAPVGENFGQTPQLRLTDHRCEPIAVQASRRPGRPRRRRCGGPRHPERARNGHCRSLDARLVVRRPGSGPPRTLPSRRRGVGGLAAHHRRALSRRGLRPPSAQRPSADRWREGSFGRVGPRLRPACPSRLSDGSGGGCRGPCCVLGVGQLARTRSDRGASSSERADFVRVVHPSCHQSGCQPDRRSGLHGCERGLPLHHRPPLLRRRGSVDRDLGRQREPHHGWRDALWRSQSDLCRLDPDPSRPAWPERSGVHPSRSAANASFGRTFTCVHGGSSAARRPVTCEWSTPSGWVGRSKVIGARACPGHVGSNEAHLGAVPTRAGLDSAPGEAGVRGEGTGAATSAAVGGDAASGALVRWVPESAALGVSALVAAAYLRRIRRRRAQARAARGDDEAVATPDLAAVRLEARLAPFANSPALEWLELANRHLTAALRCRTQGRSDAPDRGHPGRPGRGRGALGRGCRLGTGILHAVRRRRELVAAG